MAPAILNGEEGNGMNDAGSPRCSGEGGAAAQEGGGGARGGWSSSRSMNGSECSWQVMAARHSIENSLSMLAVRSRFSAGDDAAAGSLHVDWDGGGAAPATRRPSAAELLAAGEQKKNSQLILFVFCIMFLLEIFVNFDSGVIPAILVTLQKSFGIDGAAAGLLGSLPYIGLVASSPFVGRGLTTFSPKWFCFITMVVNLFATGLLGLAVQKWMLFLSRLLIGLSQAGFSIYAPVWVDQFAPAEKLTLWMGLAQGGVVVGTMLGCILAGTFDSASKAGGADSGWRYALLVQAIGLFLLLAVWLLLPRRFVDINMQQAKAAAETVPDAAAEESALGALAAGREKKEEEEQTTGVGRTLDSPQRAEASTTVSLLYRNASPANAAEQTQELQQQAHDAVVVVNRDSEAPQKVIELAATMPGAAEEAATEEAAAAAAGMDNGVHAAAAPVSDKRNSGRRYSAAGLGKTILEQLREDAAASRNGGTEEGRRWSAIAGITPGGFFNKKGEKRPATAAGGLTVAASEATARDDRPCSKALSDAGAPGTALEKAKKSAKVRIVHHSRGIQSTDTAASSEGLPKFRRNFVSNLLPLDFIATSPTFARRSSQLHPGPAPGATAAAAAGLASANGASSCSASSSASSSSIESSRKELSRNAGGGGGPRIASASVLGAHGRSCSSMLGGGTRPGIAATVQLKKLQPRKKGSSSELLRLHGGRGFRTAEEMSACPAGETDLRRAPPSVEFLPSPTEDTYSDSATAAPSQQQQQQQRKQSLLGVIAGLATAGVADEGQKRTPPASFSAASRTPTQTGNTAACAVAPSIDSGNASVIPGSATSRSNSKPLPREITEVSTHGGADLETKSKGGGDEAAAAVPHFRSSAATAASIEGLRLAAVGESGAAAAAGEAGAGAGPYRARPDSSRCSLPVNGERQQQEPVEGVCLREGGSSVAAECRVVPTAAAMIPACGGGGTGGGGVGGSAPGGVNEVQYQRIFMTPHASTLAFEAFNWAAGVADPLLLVRDNGRHYSVGGLVAVNASGTSLGSGTAGSPFGDTNAAVHAGRRRRSTMGTGSIFMRGGKAGVVAAAAPAATPAKAGTAAGQQSTEAPTMAGEDSSLSGGLGMQGTGRESSPPKKNAAPKTMSEEDLADTAGFAATHISQPGGAATMLQGRAADQRTQDGDSEKTSLGARQNIELTAIKERGSESLAEKTSVVLTEQSIATLPQEPRTFGVWQSILILFSSPLYICVTISLCALFFEVTAIQFWSITYFQEEMQVPKGQVLVAFNVTAATGPILGVLAGGWFIDFVGGYKTEKGMMKTLLILGSWATICLLLGTFACWVPNFVATIAFMWGILFFGGGILPAATGIVIASVPLEVRAFGSGFCMMIYNVFGYVLGTALPGAIVQAAGLAWGMRVVFLWSIFGVSGLYAAAFVVWRLRIRPSYYVCTYGIEKQQDMHSIRSNESMRSLRHSLRNRESRTATAGVMNRLVSGDPADQPVARSGVSQ